MRRATALLAVTPLIASLTVFVGGKHIQGSASSPLVNADAAKMQPVLLEQAGGIADADTQATRLIEELLSIVSAYDGSDAWHDRFRPYIDIEGWEYDAEQVDQTIGFVRGQEVESTRVVRFVAEDGNHYCYCEVRFKNAEDQLPVILDLTLHNVNGLYRVRSIARDMC